MTSFYPAISGRATSQLGITRLLSQINHDQQAIQDLQTQLSTGRRLATPSQDPSAAIRGLAAQRQLEYKSQVDKNLQAANTILSATESTLAQAQQILNEMRGVAVQGASNTLSPEETDALVAQVDTALSSLTELGNAKHRDQFLFAGSDVLENPLQKIGDTLRFSGNAEHLNTISDYASTISANVSANDAFGVKSNKVVGSADLDPSILASTPLSLLNRGNGVRGGAISLSNGLDKVEVDLANAYNLSDVLEKINSTQLDGRTLSASLSATGLDIRYEDGLGGLLRVNEVGSGSAAEDLHILNTDTVGQSPVIGGDLNPVATKTTLLSQLFQGTGIATGDSFTIKQGDKSYGISTTSLVTIEDLMNRIQRSGAKVEVSLDSSGRFLQLQSTESGTVLSIGENGSQIATKLGLRTMNVSTPLSDLNFGQGIQTNESQDDLLLTRSDGSELRINLTGALNIQDVLHRINDNVDNLDPNLRISASLASRGNGIVLSAPIGSQPIAVANAGGSQAAWGLGLVPKTQSSATSIDSGGVSVINGSDVSGVEVEGAFTTLIRLRQALEQGRSEDIIRVTAALDEDLQRMSLARGFVGARQQSIDRITDLSAEQQLQLKEIESNELDSDLAQVISDMSARQAALQASLQLMANASKLTLFNYI